MEELLTKFIGRRQLSTPPSEALALPVRFAGKLEDEFRIQTLGQLLTKTTDDILRPRSTSAGFNTALFQTLQASKLCLALLDSGQAERFSTPRGVLDAPDESFRTQEIEAVRVVFSEFNRSTAFRDAARDSPANPRRLSIIFDVRSRHFLHSCVLAIDALKLKCLDRLSDLASDANEVAFDRPGGDGPMQFQEMSLSRAPSFAARYRMGDLPASVLDGKTGEEFKALIRGAASYLENSVNQVLVREPRR